MTDPISASEHQHAIAETLRRRHQDAALHAASLIRQANEAIDHAAVLEREYWEVRHPITEFVTPAERAALAVAAALIPASLQVRQLIDNNEEGEDG